jgi:AraC-like DNA-binding protein
VSREVEDLNRRLLRARDAMDRAYAEPLDVRAVAAVAHLSRANFIRSFRATFGETPHRYLQPVVAPGAARRSRTFGIGAAAAAPLHQGRPINLTEEKTGE